MFSKDTIELLLRILGQTVIRIHDPLDEILIAKKALEELNQALTIVEQAVKKDG